MTTTDSKSSLEHDFWCNRPGGNPPAFFNNSSAPGNFGFTLSSGSNQTIGSFSNSAYALDRLVPAAGTAGTGTITSLGNIEMDMDGALWIQQLGTLIHGFGGSSGLSPGNMAATGTYSFTSATNLQIDIPINVAFSYELGNNRFLNGTESGQFIANATVPEPSTLALAGVAFVSLVAYVRRRRTI
jgi:PEP-CTERM motif